MALRPVGVRTRHGACCRIGSQTQKPLAIVVIGGSLILAVLTRVLQPPLLVLAHRWIGNRAAGATTDPVASPPL